ncbi:hypothetical protein [Deinococcus aestuarii]|uniref:hypothetical protein n=1 Tax=Deinococcus aestuarii TaxID=2774531 RepID=UPI001C0D3818|nr:hypothetical protein [Deinococcus aestuarii]
MKAASRLVMAVLGVLAVGILLPLLTPATPSELSADAQVFARHALRDAAHFLDNPVRRLLTLRLQVVEVVPTGVTGDCGELPHVSVREYRGT